MADYLKRQTRQTLAAVQTARKRVLKSREARAALAVIARQNGPLPKAIAARAREDAIERLGSARHALWLMVYAAVQGQYRDGWLPDSFYLEQVMPRINGTSHHLGRVRATNSLFFDSPAVCDLLYVLNGRLIASDGTALTPAVASKFLRDSAADVVFKADESGFGRGVRTFTTAALAPDKLRALGNGVLQPRIAGHAIFDRIGGEALATLRIGTVLPDTGGAQVRSCYLKLGRAGQAHVQGRDQMRIAVDWRDGSLAPSGFLSDWHRIAACPISATAFAGLQLPAIKDAVQTVLHLHRQMPLARYVCWDVAIDRDEKVHLLEWEGGVVSFAEAVQGPCFSDLGWDMPHECSTPDTGFTLRA